MMASSVQVNDATGKALTKVKAGETVKIAKLRIGSKGQLEDSTGLALLDEDIISVDGEPYMFTPSKIANYDEVVEYVRAQQAAATVNKPMSEASIPFATDLLNPLGIGFVTAEVCTETGEKDDADPFDWMKEFADGSISERNEVEATPDFRDWLQKEWLGNDSSWSVELVTGESLPKIKASGKSATGKADLCVGGKLEMQTLTQAKTEHLPNSWGIVEIKRRSAILKTPQMLLEVVALACISRYRKGVALLGTDGNDKWCIVHFTKYNEVSQQYFRHGRKCLEEYENMLSGINGRKEELAKAELAELSDHTQRLSSVPEDSYPPRRSIDCPSMRLSVANASASGRAEQDLTGFEDGENGTRDKAIENENFLRRLAEALGDLAGGNDHRPKLPEWALAKNRIPSYYS